MSGGVAYVFDERMDFTEKRCNRASVDLEPLIEFPDVRIVHDLILRHWKLTGSRRARAILDSWSEVLPRFVKVFPHEFKRVLGVSRSRQPYIPGKNLPGKNLPGQNLPGQNLPVVAVAEQVQHG